MSYVSRASTKTGISRDTHYRWIKEDPEYKYKVWEVSEELLDLAEAALLKEIKKGNIRAIIFHLRTKGKGRGYTFSNIQDKEKTEFVYYEELADDEKIER